MTKQHPATHFLMIRGWLVSHRLVDNGVHLSRVVDLTASPLDKEILGCNHVHQVWLDGSSHEEDLDRIEEKAIDILRLFRSDLEARARSNANMAELMGVRLEEALKARG